MKLNSILTAIAGFSVFILCEIDGKPLEKQGMDGAQSIFGTWVTGPHSGDWGESRTSISFRPDNLYALQIHFRQGDIITTGTYRIKGKEIVMVLDEIQMGDTMVPRSEFGNTSSSLTIQGKYLFQHDVGDILQYKKLSSYTVEFTPDIQETISRILPKREIKTYPEPRKTISYNLPYGTTWSEETRYSKDQLANPKYVSMFAAQPIEADRRTFTTLEASQITIARFKFPNDEIAEQAYRIATNQFGASASLGFVLGMDYIFMMSGDAKLVETAVSSMNPDYGNAQSD